MSTVPIPTERTHWYTPQGQPMHSVPCKSKPGEMRPVNVKDARSLALVPSVTNILGIIARPGLEAWKQEQLVLAALTLPRKPRETDDEFAKRVVEDAREHAEKAAEAGSAVHAFIAAWHTRKNPCIPAGADAICSAYIAWASKHLAVKAVERPFASPYGYGGTLDMHCIMDGAEAVIDFKTRGTTPGKPVPAYETDGLQLAAYAEGTGNHDARLINLVLSTTEPGRLEVIEWTDQRAELFEAFLAAFRMWKFVKKYNPKDGR